MIKLYSKATRLVEILDNLWENCIDNDSFLSGDCAEIERVEKVEEKLDDVQVDGSRDLFVFLGRFHFI